MGDKESRKPLSRAFIAEVTASSVVGSEAQQMEARHAHQLVSEEVEAILSPMARQGYVRLGIGRDKLYWARFKWTAGPLSGKYTFGSGETVDMALDQMCERVYACESGKRHAHTDEGYRAKR